MKKIRKIPKKTGKIIFKSRVIVPFKRHKEVNHYTIYGCREAKDQYKMINYLNYLRILENKNIFRSYNETRDWELYQRYIPKDTSELKELVKLPFSWQILDDNNYQYATSGSKIFWIDNKGYYRETDLDFFLSQVKHQNCFDLFDLEKGKIPRCYGYNNKEKPIFVFYFMKRRLNDLNWDDYDRYYIAIKLIPTNNYAWETY